jgi:GYD domain
MNRWSHTLYSDNAQPESTKGRPRPHVEIKRAFLTSGESDLLLILETPNADNIPKFAMAIGSLGNVRTRTVRAWPEAEKPPWSIKKQALYGGLRHRSRPHLSKAIHRKAVGSLLPGSDPQERRVLGARHTLRGHSVDCPSRYVLYRGRAVP